MLVIEKTPSGYQPTRGVKDQGASTVKLFWADANQSG